MKTQFISAKEALKMLNETKCFHAGQQVWAISSNQAYIYLYTCPKNKFFAYVIKTDTNSPLDGEISIQSYYNLTAIKPLPEIKQGTVVLCWDEKESTKFIAFFISYTEEGKVQVTNSLGGTRDGVWDYCEVYKPMRVRPTHSQLRNV